MGDIIWYHGQILQPEEDRSAWWYLFEFFGAVDAIEIAHKWGIR